jgi:prepilin-type N-terminal cleavage/methylation domain-containing protein
MFTIFKVLIHNSNKQHINSNGFTLLELLVGLLLMSIVGGLAMNAFVQANTSFGEDKKNIDTSQNLSAVLEIVGNDIRQAGENINDGNFPAIEFNVATTAETTPVNGLVPGSSKIIVRRAVSAPLTLCQTIPTAITTTSLATAPTSAISPLGTLIVADNALVATAPNCAVGTSTSALFAARPTTTRLSVAENVYIPNVVLAGATLPTNKATLPPLPSGALERVLPDALRQARDYRCTQADPNPDLAYDSPSQPSDKDFCPTPGDPGDPPSVRIAVSDGAGHMIILNQTGERDLSAGNYRQYGIDYNASLIGGSNPDPAISNNAIAATVISTTPTTFNPGDPVYLIEERVYTLVKDANFANNGSGTLYISKNGSVAVPLIKGITNFNISAKKYTDALQQIINPTPAGTTVGPNPSTLTNANPICDDSPTAGAATATAPQYVCKFNYNTATDVAVDWKLIAGVKVSLRAKYDGSGKTATASVKDAAKLIATAEYFPRNVLSK